MKLSPTVFFGTLWVAFAAYGFFLAPPDHPETLTLIQQLSMGDVGDLNPVVVALFNLMGIWPLVYGAVLFADGQGQKLPAWPFSLGIFALGAFVLLPYLAFRDPQPRSLGVKTRWLRLWDSRLLGVVLLLGTCLLVAYGVGNGFTPETWGDFVAQWRSSRFIHVMSLDFCLLTLLFPTLVPSDLQRRGVKRQAPWWGLSLLPLVGACLYLILRPGLPSAPAQESA